MRDPLWHPRITRYTHNAYRHCGRVWPTPRVSGVEGESHVGVGGAVAVTLFGGLAPPSEGVREGGLARSSDFSLLLPASWRVPVQRAAHALRMDHEVNQSLGRLAI